MDTLGTEWKFNSLIRKSNAIRIILKDYFMGKALKVYVTGNSPRSLKKISEFNWSGYAFYGSREQLGQLYDRQESQNSGVYFLISETNSSDMVNMYVGETENFSNRIKHHHRNKDWWSHFIVFQCDGSYLNKAHVKHLEKLFYERAKVSPQIELMNEQEPNASPLSEEDESDLKLFEDNMLFIMEALNIGFFSKEIPENTEDAEHYQMSVPHCDYHAQMTVVEDIFILKKGSYLRKVPRDSFKARNLGYFKKWQEIITSDDVADIDANACQLKIDLEFNSSSAAAAIVAGGSQNGPKTWKNLKTGKTLKEELMGNDD